MSINAGPQGLKVWAYVDVAKEHAFEASEPNAFPGGVALSLSRSLSPLSVAVIEWPMDRDRADTLAVTLHLPLGQTDRQTVAV